MGRRKAKSVERGPDTNESQTLRPATTIEGRENQLINLAINLAEKQLMEGTASSQVITHYLRLGSTKERLEQQMMAQKIELDNAKTENLKAAKRVEELYSNAIEAMKKYSGATTQEEEVVDEY